MKKAFFATLIVCIGIILLAGIIIALTDPSVYTISGGDGGFSGRLSWWQIGIFGILLLYAGIRAGWGMLRKKNKENTKRNL